MSSVWKLKVGRCTANSGRVDHTREKIGEARKTGRPTARTICTTVAGECDVAYTRTGGDELQECINMTPELQECSVTKPTATGHSF